MKTARIAALVLFASASAFAGRECTDMSSTSGIRTCLDYRTTVAEKLLKSDINEIESRLGADSDQSKKLVAGQRAWMKLRNESCQYATSGKIGDEEGFTEVGCRLSETLKRVHELEDLLEDLKTGSNKSFREAINGLVEVRDPSVSRKKIESRFGVSIINQEFNAAEAALMATADVKENRLRIKSLRLIDEGTAGVCGTASAYIAELGYFAQKTQKFVKIYVRTDLNRDRSTKAIKTSVQENIESVDPVCP